MRDQEHRAIAEAIASRSPDAAEQSMRVHLWRVQREIADRLNPVGTGGQSPLASRS
jgi:DNA-binding GntR family transcriptional regulator